MMNEHELYTEILNLMQSYWDSNQQAQPRPYIEEFTDGTALEISEHAMRAMQTHLIAQDAVNDWLSGRLNPEGMKFVPGD
jgi:hypothetical protein